MRIEELKETDEWKAASKQKRHAFLSSIEKKLKSERKAASAAGATAQKAVVNNPPASNPPKQENKKSRKKAESQELTRLAYDILRCSGINGSRLGGVGLFGAVAPRVIEVLGATYSGSVKVFMRENKEKLREWCRLNWAPREKAHQSKTQRVAKKIPDNLVKTRQPTEQSVKSFINNHSKVDPTSDDFLKTFEWNAVRMMALKRHGYRCMCCGASPATGAVINVDHIKPRKFYPELALDVENLQVLCNPCNMGKGNWLQEDFRKAA
jgi:5-methylcytosine-specific restriction endonuclease McrA